MINEVEHIFIYLLWSIKVFCPFFIGFLLAFPLLICRSSVLFYLYTHAHTYITHKTNIFSQSACPFLLS